MGGRGEVRFKARSHATVQEDFFDLPKEGRGKNICLEHHSVLLALDDVNLLLTWHPFAVFASHKFTG